MQGNHMRRALAFLWEGISVKEARGDDGVRWQDRAHGHARGLSERAVYANWASGRGAASTLLRHAALGARRPWRALPPARRSPKPAGPRVLHPLAAPPQPHARTPPPPLPPLPPAQAAILRSACPPSECHNRQIRTKRAHAACRPTSCSRNYLRRTFNHSTKCVCKSNMIGVRQRVQYLSDEARLRVAIKFWTGRVAVKDTVLLLQLLSTA